METGHFGVTPTTLCDAILTAWTALQLDGQAGTGCVRTIARLRDIDIDSVAAALEPGAPALLLFYQGGTSEQTKTHGQEEDDTLTFLILAVASSLTSVRARQDGGERDPDSATVPGVEDLQDWGRYLALRALETAGAQQPRTVRFDQARRISAEHYVATVTLAAKRTVDIFDDATANYLLSLGLCHDPTEGYSDPDAWFSGDPAETPVSDWPAPGVDGGVTDL